MAAVSETTGEAAGGPDLEQLGAEMAERLLEHAIHKIVLDAIEQRAAVPRSASNWVPRELSGRVDVILDANLPWRALTRRGQGIGSRGGSARTPGTSSGRR